MVSLRLLSVLTAAVLAGSGSGLAAQVTPPNPFATSGASRDHHHPRWHRHRSELRGRYLERRGERWERRGERWERHGARLQRHGRFHAGRSWRLRGEHLEHRGRRLERRGERLERHAPHLERGRVQRLREREDPEAGRRRWRARPVDGWL
jgi:hypothetical protein